MLAALVFFAIFCKRRFLWENGRRRRRHTLCAAAAAVFVDDVTLRGNKKRHFHRKQRRRTRRQATLHCKISLLFKKVKMIAKKDLPSSDTWKNIWYGWNTIYYQRNVFTENVYHPWTKKPIIYSLLMCPIL